MNPLLTGTLIGPPVQCPLEWQIVFVVMVCWSLFFDSVCFAMFSCQIGGCGPLMHANFSCSGNDFHMATFGREEESDQVSSHAVAIRKMRRKLQFTCYKGNHTSAV